MALISALLLTIILSTALGGIAMIAAVERRAAASHRLSAELRLAVEGALVLTAEELRAVAWDQPLAGAGSNVWRLPLVPPLDLPGLTDSIRNETVMASAHGADTPAWQLFTHAQWSAVAGHPSHAQVVTWVADDWEEQDGDPARDGNGLILVRAVAAAGVAAAWAEGLYGLEPDGRLRLRHLRLW